jgi:alanine racemase
MVKTIRKTGYRRDAWVEINLANLEYNLKAIYSQFHKPMIPILKADAYGHGATVLVKILDTYDFVHAYGVASIDEALALREASEKKIIVLGISPEWAWSQALEHDIDMTIVDYDSAVRLNELAKEQSKQARVHIKIDTGMNRIGFKYADREALLQIPKLSNIEVCSVFTHFSDPSDTDYSLYQYQQFRTISEGLKCPKHPASSQAAKVIPDLQCDYLRCGIELYGLENPDLKPLLALYSRISFIKEIESGESVSYKRSWISDKRTRIATLPLGYADGVPRSLSNKIYAYCKGHKLKQVGLVTMDQMMFDIEDYDIDVGDIIELIGPHASVSDWAKAAGTITYEIVCGLNLRLPKSYVR